MQHRSLIHCHSGFVQRYNIFPMYVTVIGRFEPSPYLERLKGDFWPPSIVSELKTSKTRGNVKKNVCLCVCMNLMTSSSKSKKGECNSVCVWEGGAPTLYTNTSLLSCFCCVIDDIIVYILALFTFHYHFLPLYYQFSTCCTCYLHYTHMT